MGHLFCPFIKKVTQAYQILISSSCSTIISTFEGELPNSQPKKKEKLNYAQKCWQIYMCENSYSPHYLQEDYMKMCSCENWRIYPKLSLNTASTNTYIFSYFFRPKLRLVSDSAKRQRINPWHDSRITDIWRQDWGWIAH